MLVLLSRPVRLPHQKVGAIDLNRPGSAWEPLRRAVGVNRPYLVLVCNGLLRCCFWHRSQPLRQSNHQIAHGLQNIPRAGMAVGCSSCKMAGQFSSITQRADLRIDDGRFSAGQKVFGDLQRSLLRKRACLDSTIRSQIRSLSGRAIRGNHRSQFDNCLAKPTGSKARLVFSGLRFATETPWRSPCQSWLSPVRLLSTAQVIFRFSANCFAGN